MSLFQNVSGEFLFHYTNFLDLISNLPQSPADYLKELVENATDAGSKEVWVVREPGSLTVIDSGHGMVPFILPEDVRVLQAYWEQIKNKTADPELDVRTLISEVSRQSLEWMAYNVGFSGKLPIQGSQIKGLRGVGAQGFRQCGDAAEWRTRPDPELAALYYGAKKDSAKNPPVFQLKPPTQEQLVKKEVEPQLLEVNENLRGLGGAILEHGTVVKISNLRKEVENALRPQALVDFLHAKFGEAIRQGDVKIMVVDMVTEGGRATRGLTQTVPPARYRGHLIVDEERRLRGGSGPFRIQLYYDPSGRNLNPTYRRLGTEIQSITALQEFNRAPFNSGKLNGPIDYPDLPEREAPWDTSKRVPQEGPVRNQWQHAIWNLEKKIETEIAKIDEDLRKQRQDSAAQHTADVVRASMDELPYYKDLTYGRATLSKPRVKKNDATPPTPSTTVVAEVLDQQTKQGVRGVTLELWQLPTPTRNIKPEMILQRETGKSGQVSFGHVINTAGEGRYQVKMVVPEGMEAADRIQEYPFNLSSNQPGAKFLFWVVSGQPKLPEARRVSKVTIVYTDKLPESEPYSAEKLETVGIIEINKDHPDYRAAEEANDRDLADNLAVVFIAHALTESGLRNHPADVQVTQSAVLTARSLSNLKVTRRRR